MSGGAIGYVVWCQGGPADDFHYETLIEPPRVIELASAPAPFDWVRVLDWGDAAVRYVRVPEVEQFGHERIYYPLGEAA